MKKYPLFMLLWLCVSGALHAAPFFVEGKDYQVIPRQAQMAAPSTPSVVTVREFFSYGCPWCYKIEKDVLQWRKTLPPGVVFKRVPVIYEKGWDVYAKAYVTADILGKEQFFTPRIFAAIHDKNETLVTPKAMMKFFIENGVKANVAKSAFFSSPTVNNRVKADMQMMQLFRINSVPSFVINNQYRVDISMMAGDTEKLFRVVGFLVAKEIAAELANK